MSRDFKEDVVEAMERIRTGADKFKFKYGCDVDTEALTAFYFYALGMESIPDYLMKQREDAPDPEFNLTDADAEMQYKLFNDYKLAGMVDLAVYFQNDWREFPLTRKMAAGILQSMKAALNDPKTPAHMLRSLQEGVGLITRVYDRPH